MTKNKKIVFLIGNRAHYARVKPIAEELKKLRAPYKIVVFEAGALQDQGDLLKELKKDHPNRVSVLYTNLSGGNLVTMTKSIGIAVSEIAACLDIEAPKMVVVIADRYEAFAGAIAARSMNIPIAHIQGGERSGSVDGVIRHAITKLSDLHFVSNNDCMKVITGMGEPRKSVFVTGCPTVDVFAKTSPQKPEAILKKYSKKIVPNLKKGYLVVNFHPVTTEYGENLRHFKTLFKTVSQLGYPIIWMYPNNDAGSNRIRKEINTIESKDGENVLFVRHFPVDEYVVVLKNALCIVGNSSVGIRESSFIGVPVVNIGTRQLERDHSENVIDVNFDEKKIKAAIERQIKHGKYKKNFLYGHGTAAPRIAKVLNSNHLKFSKTKES